jgi:hypothetical protein
MGAVGRAFFWLNCPARVPDLVCENLRSEDAHEKTFPS